MINWSTRLKKLQHNLIDKDQNQITTKLLQIIQALISLKYIFMRIINQTSHGEEKNMTKEFMGDLYGSAVREIVDND